MRPNPVVPRCHRPTPITVISCTFNSSFPPSSRHNLQLNVSFPECIRHVNFVLPTFVFHPKNASFSILLEQVCTCVCLQDFIRLPSPLQLDGFFFPRKLKKTRTRVCRPATDRTNEFALHFFALFAPTFLAKGFWSPSD